jgi:phosphatidylglycerophosphate synthase
MGEGGPKANRRPLKSRSTGWAAAAAKAALRAGLTANQISFIGIVAAAIGAWLLIEAMHQPWLVLLAAVCIQLRLLANMLDGMVAVEGGRGGPTGAVWNEFPDRIEDSLFLVAAGYAAALPWLGWLAALLAAVCAYVRLLGGTLGQPQDFGGPMAKPHRMAALTIGCIVAVFWLPALNVALGAIALGTLLTITLRLMRLSKALRG